MATKVIADQSASRSGFPPSGSPSSTSSTSSGETFELHGFASIKTRAMEPIERLAAQGEDADKEMYARPTPGGRRRRPSADAARSALRPDRAVRPLRAGERRQAELPVPPLPDPAGLARGAPAGGPLSRVHPGRHRHRRRRGAAPHFEAEMLLVIADVFARLPIGDFRIQVNNRKIPEGFYLRHRPRRTSPARCGSSTSWTRSAPTRCAELLVECRRDPRAGGAVPGAGRESARRTLSFVDQVRALGVQHRHARRGPGRAAAVDRHAGWTARPGASSPTCGSPAAWTTTPAPSTRRSSIGHESLRLGLLRRPVRRARHRRQDAPIPGVGISIGVSRLLGLLIGRGC